MQFTYLDGEIFHIIKQYNGKYKTATLDHRTQISISVSCSIKQYRIVATLYREFFSKSHQINLKSDGIYRLIWIQTNFHLDPNQSENGKYDLISGWSNKFSIRFLCVYREFSNMGVSKLEQNKHSWNKLGFVTKTYFTTPWLLNQKRM